MKNIIKLTFCVAVIEMFAGTAVAVPGTTDYVTYMYKSYQGGWQTSYSDHEQWVNWNDWRDEMDDIASCQDCQKNFDQLPSRLTGSSRNIGLNADLIAIQTHGYEEGSGSSHKGWIASYNENNWVLVNNIEPLDTEVEIYLFDVCVIYSRSALDDWYSFRNMHRYGAVVSAGCWDYCPIWEVYFIWSINTTWNEIGDNIADDEMTIMDAWWDGLSVGDPQRTPIILGLGMKSVAGQCEYRAEAVSFQNRTGWTKYTYGHNEPATSNYELCGYYSDYR